MAHEKRMLMTLYVIDTVVLEIFYNELLLYCILSSVQWTMRFVTLSTQPWLLELIKYFKLISFYP